MKHLFHFSRTLSWGTLTLSMLVLTACAWVTPQSSQPKEARALQNGMESAVSAIQNVVVIYAENHSFDNLYGTFPGANGLARASQAHMTQLDHDGTVLATLPPVFEQGKPSQKFKQILPNRPFQINSPAIGLGADEIGISPIHNFYHNQEQINGGANNMFAAMGTAGAWSMGYFDGSQFKLWNWAREYTLADNFFMGAFGGSFLNHQWLVCACTPEFKHAPASMRATLDANGKMLKRAQSPASIMQGPVAVMDGQVTPDGYVVNTSQPPYQPSGTAPAEQGDGRFADASKNPVPPQTAITIGDTLSAKNVSWAWYAGAWNAANADGVRAPQEKRNVIYASAKGAPNFQAHHQPFNYFKRFAPGTADRARHLKDGEDFERAIATGTLPQVAFYKPMGKLNQHPSYTDVMSGDAHLNEILTQLRASPQWNTMLVVVTYDENGGFWDHVPPPSGAGWGDRWGPGSRVPTLIISPFAKRGYIDSTAYDTTSILKFITQRFGLEPLAGVREKTGNLSGALELK